MKVVLILLCIMMYSYAQDKRPREYGIEIGIFKPGTNNAITDVPGVKVGHQTLIRGDHIRTGVTAILMHDSSHFAYKLPAAIHVGNGYGKLAGVTQVRELGNIETPIILTNTLSVPTGMNALITYTLKQHQHVFSVNAIVGETNDGYLNDIRGRHVTQNDVFEAIFSAKKGPVPEGNVGAGTGTVCFGWKGGIGTSSRKIPQTLGGYTVGVLVQTNFGGVLTIDGVRVGEALGKYSFRRHVAPNADGSCMIVVVTDAPVGSRNLERMAKRAMMGLARTGGIASNGSGDYVIAVSNHRDMWIPARSESSTNTFVELRNSEMSSLFLATIEATEEAIINSLFAATTMNGYKGSKINELPVKEVLQLLKRHGRLKN